MGSGPLIVMALSVIFLKDRISILRVLGFILGFIGIALTAFADLGEFSSLSIGDLMIFLSIATQAISFILISKLQPDFDPRLLTGYMLVFGSIIIFIIGLQTGDDIGTLSNLSSWKIGLVFIFSALFCTAFGHMTYNYAIKQVGPMESAIFINLNTAFAIMGWQSS